VPTHGAPVPEDAAVEDEDANAALCEGSPDTGVPRLVCAGVTGSVGRLTEVRRRLEEWAAAVGLPAEDAEDVVLASYEALTNAAEHAYADGPWNIDLVAARTLDGRVLVTVRDHGRWRTPPRDPGFRGRGLLLIEMLAHRVDIRRGPDGTAVHMQWRVPATPRP
jgi:serine/threonine-protein kinase RsbW